MPINFQNFSWKFIWSLSFEITEFNNIRKIIVFFWSILSTVNFTIFFIFFPERTALYTNRIIDWLDFFTGYSQHSPQYNKIVNSEIGKFRNNFYEQISEILVPSRSFTFLPFINDIFHKYFWCKSPNNSVRKFVLKNLCVKK